MVTFVVYGALPTACEDFVSCDPRFPSVTIVTKSELVADGYADVVSGTLTNGWLDIILDVDCIDLDVARLALADAFGIDNPEDIVIDERGVRRSD